MHVEVAMFVVWASVPVVAFASGQAALRRSARRRARGPNVDAEGRLAQLRHRPAEGRVVRGRMAEAIRLAEGPVGSALPLTRT